MCIMGGSGGAFVVSGGGGEGEFSGDGIMSTKMGQVSLKMGQKEQLLLFFFEYPQSVMTVRDLAVKLKMSRSSLQRYLVALRSEGYITSENKWIDTWFNRLRKTNYFIEKIAQSGLIDYIEEELAASSIILFGSIRKGESVKESDIDLFVECAREKNLDLRVYEKKIGHKIQMFTQVKITKLPNHLFTNVVNGIKLKGYFTLK